MSKIEFGGTDPKAVFETAAGYADGGEVAVIAMKTGDDWMESEGVVGRAASWADVERVLHDKGYRILRSGGDVSAYCGEEQGEPDEAAVIIVTVCP